MMKPSRELWASFAIGLIFGTGILIAGMGNPLKVQNFFDIAGAWDPSLAFVMGAAMIVTMIGYRLVWRRDMPLDKGVFHNQATGSYLSPLLIIGSILFGAGWGLSGYCPGGVLPMSLSGHSEVMIFIPLMAVGIFAGQVLKKRFNS